MTPAAGGRARGKRRASRAQWGGVLVAVAASLAALSLPGPARAATAATAAPAAASPTPSPSGSFDQMSGTGPTASAKTVQWTAGILDNANNPITSQNADRIASSPSAGDSFMYQDFKNLSVTVSQTQNIEHQGITVSWAGGQPTNRLGGTIQANFLQMMECWGDASTGPDPEQCEYGSQGLLSAGALNQQIDSRTGSLCTAHAVASVTNPPSSLGGSPPYVGCDPQEPTNTNHLPPCPGGGTACNTGFTVPFSPVSDPGTLDYDGTDTTYFSPFTTNEVPVAVTAADGTGQQQFEALTGVQAPGLGCGEDDNGQPRNCWLVIVPRGTYEPNGYQVGPTTFGPNNYLNTSPLSASNWDMRIQIHLGYAPVGSFCQPGTLERQTFGTQLIARAMQSWQLKLNQQANCNKVYGYAAVTESESTQNLTAGGDSGLAFTTIPIGSEAARDGTTPATNLPTILYAPIAVAAQDFGFNINDSGGYVSTPVKLTPLLLAKALTQSYQEDLPDFFPQAGQNGPSWARGTPFNISEDPQFQTLNPEVAPLASGPIAPLITEDHSAVNQKVWQWIQADSTASGWLNGTADTTDNNMTIDPDYKSSALHLGTPPALDSYPRAYTGVLNLCELSPAGSPSPSPSPSPSASPSCPTGQQVEQKHTLDLLPYAENFDAAASSVLHANNADENGNWDLNAQSPSNQPGWWDKNGVETLGQIFMWAANDTPDLAAYGLVPAQLCNASGSNCVSPTTDSVTAAVNSATADSGGLLQVNPASPGSGGYPLTDVIYAAVPTNQSAAALTDYANLISYAVGNGQTAGAAPGDLPPGYLPLPANLVTKAQAIVTQLQTLATASPSPSSSSTSPSASSSSSSTSSDQGQNNSNTGNSGSTGSTGNTTSSGTTGGGGTGTGATGNTAGTTPTPSPAPAGGAPASAAATTKPVSGLASTPVTKGGTLPAVAGYGSTTPTSLPPAQQAAIKTPQQVLGAVRWVLVAVAVIGAGFAGGGTLLSSGVLPAWRRRRML